MLVAVSQCHATRHLYGDPGDEGNEVNLIRQATRFRALVNRETLSGQVPPWLTSSTSWLCSELVRGRPIGTSFLGPRFEWKGNDGETGVEDPRLRTDLPGVVEAAFTATAGLPFSALVLRRESRLGQDKAARGWYEYPVFLRSDQSLRGVADGIGAFFLDVALAAGYIRRRAALHGREIIYY